MLITKELLDKIQPCEIFRVVTTKYQRVHRPLEVELTFVCIKGRSGDDWTIYCHNSERSIEYIKVHGDKVFSEDIIKSICPCDEEVFKLYRY